LQYKEKQITSCLNDVQKSAVCIRERNRERKKERKKKKEREALLFCH